MLLNFFSENLKGQEFLQYLGNGWSKIFKRIFKKHQWRTWFGFNVYTIALCTPYALRAQYGRWNPLRDKSGGSSNPIHFSQFSYIFIYLYLRCKVCSCPVVQIEIIFYQKNQPSLPSNLKIPFLILFWSWVESLLVFRCSPLSGAKSDTFLTIFLYIHLFVSEVQKSALVQLFK